MLFLVIHLFSRYGCYKSLALKKRLSESILRLIRKIRESAPGPRDIDVNSQIWHNLLIFFVFIGNVFQSCRHSVLQTNYIWRVLFFHYCTCVSSLVWNNLALKRYFIFFKGWIYIMFNFVAFQCTILSEFQLHIFVLWNNLLGNSLHKLLLVERIYSQFTVINIDMQVYFDPNLNVFY